MKICIILALAFLCHLAEAQEAVQWQNIPSLPAGPGRKWRLVKIPEGTLAVDTGTTPAAAFRLEGETAFSQAPLPPLTSAWTWRDEITEAVTAPDGIAYISSSSGIWYFTPSNGGGWQPTFLWNWDTSSWLVVVPNVDNISLIANAPPPPYLLAVVIRSFGAKSGYRLIHPGLNPNLVTVDAKLEVGPDDRRLMYQGLTVAWGGYLEIQPGSVVPDCLFMHSTAFSRDGGLSEVPLQQGYHLTSKAGSASWLLDSHQANYRFDGQQITALNFGEASLLSEAGEETYLSNSNGTFRRVTVSPKTYAELTGGDDPLAMLPNGTPSAISWAGSSPAFDSYYLSWKVPAVLPRDVEWIVEESSDLIHWSESARSKGIAATEWETSKYLYFSTQASGQIKVSYLHYNPAKIFGRMRVSVRPQ